MPSKADRIKKHKKKDTQKSRKIEEYFPTKKIEKKLKKKNFKNLNSWSAQPKGGLRRLVIHIPV
jgi:antitoxin component YwqK of YwqJK toxin-antitoxin module